MRDFVRVMSILRDTACVSDLRKHGKLRYEHLVGDRRGQSSVRIGFSSKYRLLFTEHETGLIINVIEISAHYGDK